MVGGLAGGVVKYAALASVRQFSRLLRDDIAVIGAGGVHTGEDVFARLIERIDTETEKASDPLDGLVRGCRAYIRFGLEHPDLYIVTFVQPSDGRPCDSEKTFEGSVAQECFNCLGGAIQACVESGQIPPVDVKKAACLCWAACHGLTSLLITHERFPWAEKDELIEGMLTSMIRGLEAGTIEALPASAANQG